MTLSSSWLSESGRVASTGSVMDVHFTTPSYYIDSGYTIGFKVSSFVIDIDNFPGIGNNKIARNLSLSMYSWKSSSHLRVSLGDESKYSPPSQNKLLPPSIRLKYNAQNIHKLITIQQTDPSSTCSGRKASCSQ